MSLLKRANLCMIIKKEEFTSRIHYTLTKRIWNHTKHEFEDKEYEVTHWKNKDNYTCTCFRFGAFMKECSHIYKCKRERS